MTDLRTYQPSFTGGELSPALWARVDLAKYATGLKFAKNVFIHPHGGASNRAGLEFVAEVKNSALPTRLIPFEFNTEQSYILEFGQGYGRVFKNGAAVLTGGGAIYEFAHPYQAAHLRAVNFCQEADVMFFAHVDVPPGKLSRLAENNWSFTTPTFAPQIQPPTTVVADDTEDTRPDGTDYDETVYRYVVAAIGQSGEESLPSAEATALNDLSIAGNYNTITWSSVPGADRYVVYKYDAGTFGYIGGTDGFVLEDENITADLSDTPKKVYNPFVGAGNYPRCLTFVDQRLAFASTKNEPQACWLSQTGNYENFGYSRPRKADDGFEFRIRSRQLNEIRSLLHSRGLLILTSGGEFIASNGEDAGPTPEQIVVKPQSFRGASIVQPIIVGSTILFAQQRGGVIRDFSYEFSEDNFAGKDLTILARHLFEGREIKAWAYAQSPNSIVWVILDDGSLVSLTYIKEHEVWAWTRHETDGSFEDVTVIGEGKEDVPYFIVRRTVGGSQKRYIERMRSRFFADIKDAFFVDCGLTYTGAPAKIISGLGHLEGRTLVALADGNVVRNLTVTAGRVTLPNAASKVHVGLPYETTLMTLDLDLGSVQGLGTVQGRNKSVAEVTFRVEKTRGIWTGPADGTREGGKLVEYKQRSTEAWNEAIRLYTGDLQITPVWDWTKGGNIVVKQFDPLPMTILAIMPDIAIGR